MPSVGQILYPPFGKYHGDQKQTWSPPLWNLESRETDIYQIISKPLQRGLVISTGKSTVLQERCKGAKRWLWFSGVIFLKKQCMAEIWRVSWGEGRKEHSRQGNSVPQGCRQQGMRRRMVILRRRRIGSLEPDHEGIAGMLGVLSFSHCAGQRECGQKHSPVLLHCWGQREGW